MEEKEGRAAGKEQSKGGKAGEDSRGGIDTRPDIKKKKG